MNEGVNGQIRSETYVRRCTSGVFVFLLKNTMEFLYSNFIRKLRMYVPEFFFVFLAYGPHVKTFDYPPSLLLRQLRSTHSRIFILFLLLLCCYLHKYHRNSKIFIHHQHHVFVTYVRGFYAAHHVM